MTNAQIHLFEELLDALLAGDTQRSDALSHQLHDRSLNCPLPAALAERAINAAALLLATGRRDQSCAVLESLLGRCDLEPAVLNNLAFAHLLAGRSERAVDLWRQASRLAPHDRLVADNLAKATMRPGT